MLVVRVYMWPRGDRTREYLVTQATLACTGVASRDEGDVVRGERRYRVRLLKGTQFGGPDADADVRSVRTRQVWREGWVRGHRPGGRGGRARGTWDLLGGALKVMLGRRLEPYVDEGSP